jgi:hypothetical protein
MALVRRARTERGASIVEFALLAPVFVALVMGIIDFGMGLSDNLALRQGVREGARQAVVANFGTDVSCTVVGASPPTATRQLMCLTKERIGGDEASLRVKVDVLGTYQRGTSMLVCAQRPFVSTSGFFAAFTNGKQLRNKVRMRIEDVVSTTFSDATETAPSGGDWSWCT